jgi:hypothetical protein
VLGTTTIELTLGFLMQVFCIDESSITVVVALCDWTAESMVVFPISPATDEDKGWMAFGVGMILRRGDLG